MDSRNRFEYLQELEHQHFDLLIIGGGVTGAGIALDAAARGLKVALIEKADFASGTSSKSTKLIHGGLRYLKQMDFALVRESGTERAVVHQLAPHLVIPEKMLLPLVEGGTYGRFLTSVGLKLYDILANVEGEDKRQMLDKEETLKKEPLLSPEYLKGSGYYAEYRTDDARLTIELIKKACSMGAYCLNYVSFDSFNKQNGKIQSINCIDTLSGNQLVVKALQYVSAAGPWVDGIRQSDGSKKGKRLHLTKGVHIVLPKEKLPIRQTVYFDVEDGRMIFAIPRQGITYVGTTDTNFNGDPEALSVSASDAQYLLDAVNKTFRDVNLKIADIESSWAGLRPLIHEDGKSPSELSRKDEIFVSDSGLISIAGGKLTGYRKMAARIIDLIFERLEMKDPGCSTRTIMLTSQPIRNIKELSEVRNLLVSTLEEKGIMDLDVAKYLLSTYGRSAIRIVSTIKAYDDPTEGLIRAELEYCLEFEMMAKAADFLVRRTGRLYFHLAEAKKYLNLVVEIMAQNLDWNNERKESEKSEMHNLFEEAITFV